MTPLIAPWDHAASSVQDSLSSTAMSGDMIPFALLVPMREPSTSRSIASNSHLKAPLRGLFSYWMPLNSEMNPERDDISQLYYNEGRNNYTIVYNSLSG